MTLHRTFLAIRWSAVGLLLGGCEATNRWFDDRVDARSTHREAAVAQSESMSPPAGVHSYDQPVFEDEITLVSNERSALHQEVAILDPVEDKTTGTSLTLAHLEQLALENNPAIRQASASVSKAAGFRDQVGLLPNPTLTYNGQQLGDAGTDQHLLTLSQDIVTGNKLGLSQHVLNQAVQAQLWEVETQRYRVLTDVRTSYYEALAAQRRLAITTDFQVIAAKGVHVAQRRKDALEGSLPEILQAEIQLQEVELQQQQAGYQQLAAWKELTAIVGLSDLALTELDGELPQTGPAKDWDSVYAEIVASSPELHAAQSRVDRASANLCRQDAQAIPNIELDLSAGQDLGTNSSFAQVGVGLPIPVFNRNEGNISAAHAEYCRATQDYQRLRMSLKSRLARAAQEYDSALAAVQRYEGKILPKAGQSLSLSEQAYTAQEFDFLQVLVARRTYFESNLRAVDARRQLAQATAQIDGLLLSGGLGDTTDTGEDDSLRGQALSGQ